MEEIKNIPDMKNAAPIDIAKKMISILDEKDAKGIKLLHVEDQTVLCDYFIICNGNSNTQIKAYAGELEYKMELAGIHPHTCHDLSDPRSDEPAADPGPRRRTHRLHPI